MKVRLLFSVLHCYSGQEQGATLQPGTEKPVTSSPHFNQKEKKSKTLPFAGKCMLPVFWCLNASYTRSTWSKV
jgi:hypothetical protein